MRSGKRNDMRDALQSYLRPAKLLRQIQSNKAKKAEVYELRYLSVTVIAATLVSVIGFSGTDRISGFFSRFGDPTFVRELVEGLYILAVLAILLSTLVGLVFRFGERATKCYRAVDTLTEFIRDVNDQVKMHDAGVRTVGPWHVDLARVRYKGILLTLPSSNDKDYRKASDDLKEKDQAKVSTQ